MQDAIFTNQRTLFQKVLTTFIITLLVATVGVYIGQFVPSVYMLPIMIAELILLIAAFWLRRKKAVGYTFVYLFSLISGVTTYPVVNHYVSTSGAEIVLVALGSTVGIFTVMGIIGATTKKDLGVFWSFLLVALLALIFVGFVSIFTPLNSAGLMAFSVIGAIVFSLYIIYDFNQMKHRGISEEMVPLLALSLYLDFINLFVNLLQFIGLLPSKD